MLAASVVRPTFNSRYLLPMLPLALLAMAAGIWRLRPRALRLAAAAMLVAGQGVSLTGQDQAYALRKPDYKRALQYAGRRGWPATGTAVWELQNLSDYYAGRREIPAVRVVSRPEAMSLPRVLVFVPAAYPLEQPHLRELRERVQARAGRAVAFAGVTVYEVGTESNIRMAAARAAGGVEP
jgi:hypothetical protein